MGNQDPCELDDTDRNVFGKVADDLSDYITKREQKLDPRNWSGEGWLAGN